MEVFKNLKFANSDEIRAIAVVEICTCCADCLKRIDTAQFRLKSNHPYRNSAIRGRAGGRGRYRAGRCFVAASQFELSGGELALGRLLQPELRLAGAFAATPCPER